MRTFRNKNLNQDDNNLDTENSASLKPPTLQFNQSTTTCDGPDCASELERPPRTLYLINANDSVDQSLLADAKKELIDLLCMYDLSFNIEVRNIEPQNVQEGDGLFVIGNTKEETIGTVNGVYCDQANEFFKDEIKDEWEGQSSSGFPELTEGGDTEYSSPEEGRSLGSGGDIAVITTEEIEALTTIFNASNNAQVLAYIVLHASGHMAGYSDHTHGAMADAPDAAEALSGFNPHTLQINSEDKVYDSLSHFLSLDAESNPTFKNLLEHRFGDKRKN